jgi:DNA-binding response OmpR family regulator
VFTAGELQLNVESHKVIRNGKSIELTQKEFALLEMLLRNKGKVCRRTRIIEKVWDIHFDKDTAVIDVFINSLRKKIDIKGHPSLIQTVRGIGYCINDDNET